MTKISNELDRLADVRDRLADVNTRIAEAIPADLVAERDSISAEAGKLEGSIKKIATSLRTDHKHTFRGRILQVVYTNSVSYPKAALIKNVPPRYLKLAAKVSTSWSIRKAAAK